MGDGDDADCCGNNGFDCDGHGVVTAVVIMLPLMAMMLVLMI